MKSILRASRFLAAFLLALPIIAADKEGKDRREPNTLTAEEKAKGWKLLFDGKSTTGWRSFKKTTFPENKGWVVEDGCFKHTTKGGGGDIISDATFENFDLRWEWKVAQGANSGLKYFISEERSSAIGHEYQLIDDERHEDAQKAEGKRVTASFYDVLKPSGNKPKPAGEWNSSRVLVDGRHVEHWLNGVKVLEYELGSEALLAAVAASKFNKNTGFGTRVQCHLLLQDHGDEISFRNLRILELPGGGK
jgi:hypothetical protein